MEAQSPFAVARFFLEKSGEGVDLSPMKLIKLVYIAHGWHLAYYDSPLIDEPVRAWKYGPVIESLYHGFKEFGNSPIPPCEAEKLPELPSNLEKGTKDLLEKVWIK